LRPTPADWRKYCAWLLAFFTLTRLVLIGLSDLKFEEAYYWDYSQHPDLSYFDHPPFVAWMIGLSTWLLGDTSFAVRLPAVLLFSGSCLLLGKLADQLFGTRAAFLSLLLLNSLPALDVYALIILPDNPLLFFWSLGLNAGWQLISRADTRWWWAVGVATGLGMDAKYPALLIPAGIFFHCFWSSKRSLALNLPMLGSALLAIGLFSPVILWNIGNGMASFKFQGTERMGEAIGVGERLGSWLFQFGLLTPPAFIAMGIALVWAWRRKEDERIRYLLCWCLPFLALMAYVSTRRLVQINWPMPAYVAGSLLMAAWLDELCTRPSAPKGWLISVFGTAFVFSTVWWLPLVVPIGTLNRVDDVTQWAPFGHKALEIRATMPHPQSTFLAGNGYQAAAEIAFTTKLPHLTLSSDTLGEPNKAFTFWDNLASFSGWDCVYANYAQPTSRGTWRERVELDPEKLRARFDKVDGPEELIVNRGGAPLRRYQYYRCYGYRPPI